MDWAEVFKQILKWFPRFEIIDEDEGGLFLRGGKLKKKIGAGVYFLFPFFDQITRYCSATRTLESTNQSITTKDKKDILISWSATYLVHDPVKAFLTTDDIDDQIISSLSARVVDYVGKHDYVDVKAHLLKNNLLHKDFLNEFQEEWGINLVGFYPHDLGLHKILRLVTHTENI